MNYRADPFPLAPMQRNVLADYLSSRQPGSYVQQLLGTIDESLDHEKFGSAWRQLAARNPSLRTCFDLGGEYPVQRVVEPIDTSIEFVDWQALSEASVDQALDCFLEADRQRGFDIGTAPLFRVTVLQLSERRYHFVWTSHHLVFDGRSRYRLLKELFALYRDNKSALESMGEATSYRKFVGRCLESGGDTKRFWRNAWPLEADIQSMVESLHGCSSDRRSGHGLTRRQLDRSFTSALRQFVRRLSVGETTPFHAAYALLSNRYTGSSWSVFGVTRSCRRLATDDFVGLCANTVPLAVNVELDDTVSSLLQRARSCWRALDAYDHSALSDIAACRGNHGGLFDVVLNFESYELNDRLRHDGPEWQSREFQLYGTTNLPLVISIYAGQQYELELVYKRSVLDEPMAASLLEQYATILSQLIRSADRRVSDIRLISEATYQRLTDFTNAAKLEQTVTERFQTIVESQQDAVALSFGDLNKTYGDLDRDANQIAAALVRRGIRQGDRVGVLLDRSLELVASWLGILKAGAVYVPMEPRFPLERNQFITCDAEIAVVVSERNYAESAQALNVEILFTESLNDTLDSLHELNPETTPDSAAYVMYTSGSTGDPKGVAVPHRGIVRLVCDNDYVSFGPKRTFLLHSSVVFDASTFELWGALLNGARCVIYDPADTGMGPLGDTIRSRGIDCLWLTSSLFNLIVEERIEILSGVRELLVGGEDLSVPHVTRALDALPHTQLINGYGPTENTTFSCAFRIPREFDRDRRHVPIGRPIRHTYAYIVDRAGLPVPVGYPGELLLGGAGLALGYLNRDQLTSNSFVIDAFDTEEGARVYRSGDRCRWLDDGQIEFLGRFDDQQKVRGFRVEPGETTAVLNRHPSVTAAATLIVTSPAGDKQLHSWAVSSPPGAITGKDLRAYVADRLPDFSVPSRIHVVERMPLTINGKLDRDRLLADRQHSSSPETVESQSAVARMLASTFESVLGITGIEPGADFFELGGNSLSAMRFLHRVEEKLGVRISLAAFLHASTVESFTKSLLDDAQEITMAPHGEKGTREDFYL